MRLFHLPGFFSIFWYSFPIKLTKKTQRSTIFRWNSSELFNRQMVGEWGGCKHRTINTVNRGVRLRSDPRPVEACVNMSFRQHQNCIGRDGACEGGWYEDCRRVCPALLCYRNLSPRKLQHFWRDCEIKTDSLMPLTATNSRPHVVG